MAYTLVVAYKTDIDRTFSILIPTDDIRQAKQRVEVVATTGFWRDEFTFVPAHNIWSVRLEERKEKKKKGTPNNEAE